VHEINAQQLRNKRNAGIIATTSEESAAKEAMTFYRQPAAIAPGID
jgi:hypothetical protein